jgi:hypothetical protein
MNSPLMRLIAVATAVALLLSLALGAFGNCNLDIGHPSKDGPPAAGH